MADLGPNEPWDAACRAGASGPLKSTCWIHRPTGPQPGRERGCSILHETPQRCTRAGSQGRRGGSGVMEGDTTDRTRGSSGPAFPSTRRSSACSPLHSTKDTSSWQDRPSGQGTVPDQAKATQETVHNAGRQETQPRPALPCCLGRGGRPKALCRALSARFPGPRFKTGEPTRGCTPVPGMRMGMGVGGQLGGPLGPT